MGFADAYLLKAGLRKALTDPAPHNDLKITVTIPVYNESGLERCLDSLFQCSCGTGTESPVSGFHAEVLIMINAPSEAPGAILEHNRTTLENTLRWIEAHHHPHMDFHVWLDHSFRMKEAGVGMARKILMDEAVRRFNMLERPGGIIASMDADATVQPNYLEALVQHFQSDNAPGRLPAGSVPDGCAVRFEHPLGSNSAKSDYGQSEPQPDDEFPPEIYRAVTQYELHLRYYLQSVRFTGYPYAYHTVGSAFAVRADIYCKEGGMNRRKGGEDFYFIQKVAQRGHFSQCNNTCVVPSPRPSDRVPFGTGPVVSKLMKSEDMLKTYNSHTFAMLKKLFEGIIKTGKLHENPPEPLRSFLEEQQFDAALEEIRSNSASPAAFRKRFWRWFNMFRILKFIHFARERGYPDIPVGEAASELLRMIDPENRGIPAVGSDLKKLLLIYRMLDTRS
jgi:glycosyltransferase involved in cell wall biosynthesis